MAASEASKEAVYLHRFANEIGVASSNHIDLGVDNTAAQQLSLNPEHHERTKHIERRHFFIRELVESGVLHVPYVNTVDNLADFFTKPLVPGKFEALRDAIMNVPYGHASEVRKRRARDTADGGVFEGAAHAATCMPGAAPNGCHWVDTSPDY